MITPRQTRLVRASDLHEFRRSIPSLCRALDADERGASAVVVPTQAAARELARSWPDADRGVPLLLTRDELYDELRARLRERPRPLSPFERDAIMQAAAADAARESGELPFRLRPGLVAEMLRFYDHLRRQSQQISRFQELIAEALGGDDSSDRGAARLLRQTRFLVHAFRGYEQRVLASGACDEHVLRARLLDEPVERPLRHVIVTVPDWIADPAGLFVADFELLTRVPALQTLHCVCTLSILGSGFHERLHNWWPGLDDVDAAALIGESTRIRPLLLRPDDEDADRLWFTHRDREEELVAVANRLREGDPDALERAAVVFKQPLPYLYLAPATLGAAGVSYQVADGLPLAAEPMVATIDLILDLVETRFAREALIALLRSPHLQWLESGEPLGLESIAALNRALSEARYLGGLDRLEAFAVPPDAPDADAALRVGQRASRELSGLLEEAPASRQIACVIAFLDDHLRPLNEEDWLADRETRARAAVMGVLNGLATSHSQHHDPNWTIDDLAAAIRRWIGDETFFTAAAAAGVRLLDDQAARYADLDDITIVGLIENEWPERPRRNIFYPPTLLKSLGWPSERDRRAAADARFLDLLASSSERVELSTFTLDDDALVIRSIQLDEVPLARLSTMTRKSEDPAWSPDATPRDPRLDGRRDAAVQWLTLRTGRSPAGSPQFHGSTGPHPATSWSVSALETYLACPFKFFAQHVLELQEEPDDEEVMDPRRQGQFVHEVFEAFFREWQAEGHRDIVAGNLEAARELFTSVVDRALETLQEGEAGLERARLLGSAAAVGLGEAVFRMEAERPVAVVERLLEHPLKGRFTIRTDAGPRDVELRGKADRVDLLADGTFCLVDYKLGWPPDRRRALQLPIYGICAEQRLDGYRGRRWMLGEAAYLAFKGPKRVVPLFTSASSRDEVLASAQQRMANALDAIGRGEFPPAPDDVFLCETCSFSAVCRKDYVGEI